MSSRLVGCPAAILVALACFGSCSRADDPPDLVRHMEKIRELRMTESALDDLDLVASIRTGEKLLRFVEGETPGEVVRSYVGTSCNLPEAAHGRVAQLQAALRKTTLEDRDALRPYADGDGSGFVSTAEAADFRDLIELGFLAAWMIEEQGASLDRIAGAAGLSPEAAAARLAEYNRVAGRLNAGTRRPMPVIRSGANR